MCRQILLALASEEQFPAPILFKVLEILLTFYRYEVQAQGKPMVLSLCLKNASSTVTCISSVCFGASLGEP